MNCKRDRECRVSHSPCLAAGLAMNLIYQLAKGFVPGGWPEAVLCLWEGAALGLMGAGLLLSPGRARAIGEWKRAHLPFLCR